MKILLNIFVGFFTFFKYPFYALLIVIVLFCFMVFLNYFYLVKIKKMVVPKSNLGKHKKISALKKYFLMLPHMVALDMVNRPEDFFREQGIIIFTGRQGRGKSIGCVEFAHRLKKIYPKSKLLSNMDLSFSDATLKHWKMLVNFKNIDGPFKGIIVIIDELQNWFSSSQSKNFPPQMLSVITQNRKNRRLMLGTAQSFNLLAKSIRTQVTEIRECNTFFGCFTIVVRKEPFVDYEGNVIKLKFRGIYSFVHTKDIRESYDTYSVVKSLSDSGFVDKNNSYVADAE